MTALEDLAILVGGVLVGGAILLAVVCLIIRYVVAPIDSARAYRSEDEARRQEFSSNRGEDW